MSTQSVSPPSMPTVHLTAIDDPRDPLEICETLALTHYENFPVVTRFFPESLRPAMYTVYAFCRHTDDLGDEAEGDRRALLAEWREDLRAEQPKHPILRALFDRAIRPFGIPLSVFERLIEANLRDQTQTRHESFADLVDYCRYSATPVGEMVLYLMGEASEENIALSDEICTGLQLANFWQDVAVDWHDKGRVYIPCSDLEDFGVNVEDIAEQRCTTAFRALMAELVGRARDCFRRGEALERRVAKRFQIDLTLFRRGGLAILDAIERRDFDVLTLRPTLSKGRVVVMVLDALVRQGVQRVRESLSGEDLPDAAIISLDPAALQRAGAVDRVSLDDQVVSPSWSLDDATLEEAFTACRARTKQAAGNFYQAFRLLGDRRAGAIFALYEFCRLADDIVDEPGPTDEERAEQLDALDAAVSTLFAGGDSLPPARDEREAALWPALADTISRYQIAERDLHLMVEGCRDDLSITRYETFEALAGYCYKVASVVALLVMPIFDDDPGPLRPYARYGGFAVQMTNILRDVAEDAERDRIYLPLEDLAAFGVSEADVLEGRQSDEMRALLAFEASKIKELYACASERLPRARRGRQQMLEGIRAIYRALLDEISASNYDVFGQRASLSTRRKLTLALSTNVLGRVDALSEHLVSLLPSGRHD